MKNMIPCNSREAVVTVISYENGIMRGFLQHPRLEKKEEIRSLSQMVLLLEDLLDMESCPRSPFPFVSAEGSVQGSIAEFRIQILFREHYTWQGKLVWKNEGQEMVFRSTVELMRVLDEILAK